MSKDRARPFSRKHRRYWIPITGGMLLIGVLNVAIGVCSYTPPGAPPERIIPVLPPVVEAARPPGSIGLGEVPAEVMRTFAATFPQNVPRGARKLTAADGSTIYELTWGQGQRAELRPDGTLVTPAPAAPAPR